jgi:hypothetical protein
MTAKLFPAQVGAEADSVLPGIARDLKRHLALCEEVMALIMRENQALAGGAGYEPFDFYRQRKALLPQLDQSLDSLRQRRMSWQKLSPAERAGSPAIKDLFQSAQALLMRVLLLDRENQQALLRRGMLPAQHLPAAAAQQPHCVAALYRRHAQPEVS